MRSRSALSVSPKRRGSPDLSTAQDGRAGRSPRFAGWRLVGDWRVRMESSAGEECDFDIPPPQEVRVQDELAPDGLPEPKEKTDGWLRGLALSGVRAEECTISGALLPASLVVKNAPGRAGTVLMRGRDYDLDPGWGTVWRLPGGNLPVGQRVWMDYTHVPQRLDSVVGTASGQVTLRGGTPHTAMPLPPPLADGEKRLANFYLPGPMNRLEPNHLFPILETLFPQPSCSGPSPAETCLPRTMAKLRSGEPLRILAWGDSVTEVGRYQPLVLEGLRIRFPKAKIQLLTEAWPGKSTVDYLAEPPGSEYHFEEKVLGAKPDLVISEFVNDASLEENEAGIFERHGRLLAAFRKIGAEWIILTPHYVKPDWMGLTSQRDIDEDPRLYVRCLREFARANRIALADASRRYGRLWRQGIPFLTLMENGINHPNRNGHQIFADSLISLFAGTSSLQDADPRLQQIPVIQP